jgi:hypothetical protein
MNTNNDIYGAFASILISYQGSMHLLATNLAEALNLGSFLIEPNEEPPYDERGSHEVLGWEIWLKHEPGEGSLYRLSMETEHSLQETVNGNMHDLSPWLARLVSTLCDVQALPSCDRKL